MSLEQRVARLEKELESRTSLPVMVWWGGMRDEALACFLTEYGREPETEIGICFVAPKTKNH